MHHKLLQPWPTRFGGSVLDQDLPVVVDHQEAQALAATLFNTKFDPLELRPEQQPILDLLEYDRK